MRAGIWLKIYFPYRNFVKPGTHPLFLPNTMRVLAMSRNSYQLEIMKMRLRKSFEFESGLSDSGEYGFRKAGLKIQNRTSFSAFGFEVLSEEFQSLQVGVWGGGNDTLRQFSVTSTSSSLHPSLTLPTTPSQHPVCFERVVGSCQGCGLI